MADALVVVLLILLWLAVLNLPSPPRRGGGYRPLPPANGRPWAGCKEATHERIHDCVEDGELRPPRVPAVAPKPPP